MEDKKQEKCPNCGRLIYTDRPSCLYCGWKRPISGQERSELQKKLLGVDSEPNKHTNGAPAKTAAPSICPNCLRPVKQDAKFCTGCGGNLIAPEKQKPSALSFAPIVPATVRKPPFSVPSFSSDNMRAYKPPTHTLWLAGIILFLAGSLLPFGILPALKAQSGIGDPWPVQFPRILYLTYTIIILLVFLSVTDFETREILKNRKVRTASACAGAFFLFLLFGLFFNKTYFFVLFFFYAGYVFLIYKSTAFFSRLPQYASLVLVTDLYVLLITLFLKNQILPTTGAGFLANRGFYVHLAAIFIILAGCLINVSHPKNPESGEENAGND